jgi:uncharacterized membrane protein YkoI
VLLSGALVFPAYAEKVKLEQLPSDLQNKIRAQVGSNPVEDIDRETRNGRTIYEVAFKENGKHREIQIEHTDAPVSTSTTSSAPASGKIRYQDLPERVKRVADSHVQGAEVNDVDRQTKNGQTTYEIGFKRNDGDQQELLLSENGEVLRNRTRPNIATSTSTPGQPNYRGVIPGQPSSATTRMRTMQYDQLPANVRSVTDARLSDGHVSKVQRVIQASDVWYQVDFKKEDGRNQQLVVAEDGRVIRDQFISATSVGAPATSQQGSASSTTSSSAKMTAPVQLLSAQEIRHSQIPVGVARVVRGYTTNANIEEIHRGTWNGREVYQVTYRDNNNQLVRLQLDANGNVIFDPRVSAATPAQGVLNNLGRLFDNK